MRAAVLATVCAAVGMAIAAPARLADALDFSDGGFHVVDYDTMGAVLSVSNGPGGAPTTVFFAPGAEAFTASVYQTSVLQIFGGEVVAVFAYGESFLTIEGGTVDTIVRSEVLSTIRVSGGQHPIGLPLEARGGSRIRVFGSGFERRVGGVWVPLPNGPLPGENGIFRGVLDSGDPIQASYEHMSESILGATGTIEVVPEPGALVLLFAGALGLALLAPRRPSAAQGPRQTSDKHQEFGGHRPWRTRRRRESA